MTRIVFIFFFCSIPFLVSAQGDILLLRKKGKVFRSYFPNSEIIYNAGSGMRQARISELKNDTLFLVEYQVSPVITSFGIPGIDTLGSYRYTIAYRDIVAVGQLKEGWTWHNTGVTLFGGGAILTTAGLLTWVFSEKNTRYYARPEFVIAAAAATVAGFLLMQVRTQHQWEIGKKYTLEYINTK